MTDKIDYRNNAEERIKLAITQGTTEEGFLVAQIAMAEATLALVEQQRIANLLTIAQFSHRADDGDVFTGHELAVQYRQEAGVLLGLDEEAEDMSS